MSAREWLNHNAVVSTGAAVLLLVVAMTVLISQLYRSNDRGVYHWDLDADTAFVHTPDPEGLAVTAPSGGRGVAAHLYTCGDCTPDEWFGYLEKYDPDAEAYLVRALDGDRWVSQDSEEGDQAMIRIEQRMCEATGERARFCMP